MLRSRPALRALALGVALASAPVFAAVLARDDFTGYADGGPPTGPARGSGWARSWNIGQDVIALARSGEPAPRVEVGGRDTVRALVRRLFRPVGVGGKPVYFRNDFSIEASLAEMDQVFGGWYFADAQGYRPALAAAVIGVRGGVAARLGEQSAEVKGRLEPGVRHTLIARLDGWDEATQTFTRVTVWLDPDKIKEPGDQLRQAACRADAGTGPVELLYFRTHNLGEARFHFYDVRFADTWVDAISD